MRRVKRVPDKHHVAKRPALVPEPWEIAPDRLVGNETVALQGIGENAFADGARLVRRPLREAIAFPRRTIAFDDKRAHPGRVPVVMGIEMALVRTHEGLRQRFEALGGSKPGELVVEV